MEWDNGTKEHLKLWQYSPYQDLSVEVKEPGILGSYNSSAFSVLDTITPSNNKGPRVVKFYPGDLVQIRTRELAGIQLRDENTGEEVDYRRVRNLIFLEY